MSEAIKQTEPQNAGSDPSTNDVRPARWTRNHMVWTLILLSLTPGGVITLFRDRWLELPAGVKGAVYLTSAILIVAACSLILTRADSRPRDATSEPASNHDS